MTELAQVLRQLAPVEDPDALVDASTGDDAAVYRLTPERALVVSTDFFTPIVDDPFDFGRIAAANALSDVYAMGGRPLFALNLVGFPRDRLGEGILDEIVRGGGHTCREAGIPVLGGHSIDDPEPKFGLVAVGEVDPERMVTNSGARPGDLLFLTKPLGSGAVATAIKAGVASGDVVRRAVEVMAGLNRAAAEAGAAAGVRAGTDVTGYGLLGHLRNLMKASGSACILRSSTVPLIEGAAELVAGGHVPGGTKRNMTDVADDVVWRAEVPDAVRTLLADAQTSGGLLLCVAPDHADELGAALNVVVPASALIGEVEAGPAGRITVV